ncbi:ribosome biogenesis protein SLX9-domain-containing protein [Dichomitus squalens]|uniref:Ribosome biogenesis protein SLX9 n=1 Tax=Dichomitus squalens TaxID=114155 RepID=A0A4Q9NXA0_9APHY|nr:ribosome biogenesis protein SLX9-domain-containing protein [Dichomitus squalens]TBU61977.1 ribosome biogenesis protein SLX9-domain-containing protein [Dichomitus squalens]
MPKEKRRRSGAHERSVRLPTQREFAVQDNAVEHVTIGEQSERSAPEILADMAADEEPRPTLKKKEKQALKHQLFIERLEQSRSPYSKSHERRLKRKAREQVAGGMSEIKAAISAVEDDIPEAVQNASTIGDATEASEGQSKPRKVRPKPGQIGEGKGTPLTKSQRKRALQVERMRIPMILATPEFAANPFQTIRTHAQNTLLKHEPPAASPA